MVKPRLSYQEKGQSARSVSGQFSQLAPAQIRDLREAFSLLDKDGDGVVGREDVGEMLVSLGMDASDQTVQHMLEQLAAPLNFSTFLTAMSADLAGISTKEELTSAFEALDSCNDGHVALDELVEGLVDMGMSEQEVRAAVSKFSKSSAMLGDRFCYRDFVGVLRQ